MDARADQARIAIARVRRGILVMLFVIIASGCSSLAGLQGRNIPHTGTRASWETVGIERVWAELLVMFCARYAVAGTREYDCCGSNWHAGPTQARPDKGGVLDHQLANPTPATPATPAAAVHRAGAGALSPATLTG